jgi:hypothetical protein
MTTQSWSTRIRHDSDVLFREWGLELNGKFSAAGLVNTADTGQIDWVTVVRAGTNANAGYEIWRMADAMQGTAPVFFRIDYGTGGNTSSPRIQITVGTGTNGAGTITGTAISTARSLGAYTSSATSDTARQSYLCVVDGFFGMHHKSGATTAGEGMYFFCRTVDTGGVASAIGGLSWWGAVTETAQAYRYAATAVTYTVKSGVAAIGVCIVPMTPTNSLVGPDNQVYLCWTITPRVAPLVGICGVFDTEVTAGNTFTATLVGGTSRTYIGLTTFRNWDPGAVVKPAMLWE